MGSPLFCLFSQQQQWREGAERPTQLLRLTYTTTLQSLSLPPLLSLLLILSLALSPIHRATCHTPSLNTPIDARGDEVVGVQLRSSGVGDTAPSSSLLSSKITKQPTDESKQRHHLYGDTINRARKYSLLL